MINFFRDNYDWLSNFYLVDVVLDSIIYSSVEHAYQASKSLDFKVREEIRLADTPAKAKKLGKKLKLRKDWSNKLKLDIMERLLRQKFIKGSFLANKLLNTGNEEIIEGNFWNDVYWGVCNGKGKNHLGIILMKIRDDLKEDSLRNL